MQGLEKREFAHIVGDKEQELSSMTLRVGDNLATFANKFHSLFQSTGV